MRHILIILIISCICIPTARPALAVSTEPPPQADKPAGDPSKTETDGTPAEGTGDEGPPEQKPKKTKHAHMIDEKIRKVEEAIKELRESYKKGTMWDSPCKDIPPDEPAGKRLMRYALLAPSYVVRFGTWPVALVGDLLIRKGVVTKVVNIISNDERTLWVYPRIELGFGSGFGGGVGLKHFDLFDKNLRLSTYYQIHINLNHEFSVTLTKPDAFYLADRPVAYQISTKFFRHLDTDFYGMGIQSSNGARSKYGLNYVRSGGWLGYEVIDNLMIGGHSYFLWNMTEHGKGGTGVDSALPSSELTGFNMSVYYANIGLDLTHDTRDSDVVPERGGLRSISFSRLQGLNSSQFDYNQYDLNIAQYFSVLMPRNVLVLRTAWTYQQQTGDGIPFYHLAKFDVNSPARGFDFSRFSDRGSAVFNVEYRFPVWRFMDGQIFFDTGRVFHSPGDFSFKHFKYSGGAGLRLRTSEFFLMRFQFAYGGEGAKFLVKTSQEF